MLNELSSESHSDQPMIYQIKIKGYLGDQWANWFDGLEITLEKDGNTLLTGQVIDQAALYGVLKKVRDLGMPLLSINSVGFGPQDTLDNKQVTHE
jgi:hypothetical protein